MAEKIEILTIFSKLFQQYIHVLSRPMVIAKSKRYKWTNVYMDVGSQVNFFKTSSIFYQLILVFHLSSLFVDKNLFPLF